MRPTRFDVGCFALAAVLALTWACDDEDPDRRPATPSKSTASNNTATKANPEAPAPEDLQPGEAKPDELSYEAVGKRDPFRSFIGDMEESKPEKKLEPTEEYELDQYRLTGLITGTAQPKAMVEDPKGRGHTLRIGSRLGKKGGRVTRITSTGIVVTEEMRHEGERILVPIQIELPKPELDLELQP